MPLVLRLWRTTQLQFPVGDGNVKNRNSKQVVTISSYVHQKANQKNAEPYKLPDAMDAQGCDLPRDLMRDRIDPSKIRQQRPLTHRH